VDVINDRSSWLAAVLEHLLLRLLLQLVQDDLPLRQGRPSIPSSWEMMLGH
jgi:hypothetical protein